MYESLHTASFVHDNESAVFVFVVVHECATQFLKVKCDIHRMPAVGVIVT